MLVELDNVTKSYPNPDGTTVPVLRGIYLRLAAGESVAIVGPSGSGKSTLLNLLGALDRPDSGSIRIAGRELARLTEAELARLRNEQIGFVFQLHHLLPQCTVWDNVLLPTLAQPADAAAAAAARQRAARLLERVGLGARRNYFPGQLSGGERQRVAVVRALINAPQLVLADEPTGALDQSTAASVGQLLVELNREEGVALVVVTHSMELARRLGRVLELRDGMLYGT